MLDLTTESLISLAEAAKLIPPSRGKRVHVSTILRWILRGSKAVDGSKVKLDGTRLGGRWITSRQALQRYTDALTPVPAEAQTPRTPQARQRASANAAKQLQKLNF